MAVVGAPEDLAGGGDPGQPDGGRIQTGRHDACTEKTAAGRYDAGGSTGEKVQTWLPALSKVSILPLAPVIQPPSGRGQQQRG